MQTIYWQIRDMIQAPLSRLYEEAELNHSSLPIGAESTQVLMTVSYAKSVIWSEGSSRNYLIMILLVVAVIQLA